MRFFEELEIGARRELGSFTFTAEAIKEIRSQFDPQTFHLDEEAGRRSLFGGLARRDGMSGRFAETPRSPTCAPDEGGGRARGDRDLGTVAGLSRPLDQAGAGRRHHQLLERHRDQAVVGEASRMGALCRPATPAPISAANWYSFLATAFVPRRNAGS